MASNYKDLAKRIEKDRQAVPLSAEYLKWDKPNVQIVGKLLAVDQMSGEKFGKPYNMYVLRTDDGVVKFSMGGQADTEIGSQMTVGGVYSITYEGKEQLEGNRQVNRFKVWQLPPELLADADVPF